MSFKDELTNSVKSSPARKHQETLENARQTFEYGKRNLRRKADEGVRTPIFGRKKLWAIVDTPFEYDNGTWEYKRVFFQELSRLCSAEDIVVKEVTYSDDGYSEPAFRFTVYL